MRGLRRRRRTSWAKPTRRDLGQDGLVLPIPDSGTPRLVRRRTNRNPMRRTNPPAGATNSAPGPNELGVRQERTRRGAERTEIRCTERTHARRERTRRPAGTNSRRGAERTHARPKRTRYLARTNSAPGPNELVTRRRTNPPPPGVAAGWARSDSGSSSTSRNYDGGRCPPYEESQRDRRRRTNPPPGAERTERRARTNLISGPNELDGRRRADPPAGANELVTRRRTNPRAGANELDARRRTNRIVGSITISSNCSVSQHTPSGGDLGNPECLTARRRGGSPTRERVGDRRSDDVVLDERLRLVEDLQVLGGDEDVLAVGQGEFAGSARG